MLTLDIPQSGKKILKYPHCLFPIRLPRSVNNVQYLLFFKILIGNQLNSESSAEIYGKLLRKGVRCLEIDLWNGNDGTPDVTHGNTLCTKIKLEEVLKVIANNTGSKSANLFPVILSLEDHCSIGKYFTLASF